MRCHTPLKRDCIIMDKCVVCREHLSSTTIQHKEIAMNAVRTLDAVMNDIEDLELDMCDAYFEEDDPYADILASKLSALYAERDVAVIAQAQNELETMPQGL